jgi:SAM-dependent methyltransferase
VAGTIDIPADRRARAGGCRLEEAAVPSIDANLETWTRREGDWWDDGDGWSEDWGGPPAQWWGTLYPRLRPFLPAAQLLEIAPGHGRWTQFLLQECDDYVGIDLTPDCVEACKQRFKVSPKASFAVNDGRSLPSVADAWADLVVSFDSLVHADIDVLRDYAAELARVLSRDGVAVLHHSNAGTVRKMLDRTEPLRVRQARLPRLVRRALTPTGVLDRDHWRARSVTAALVRGSFEATGLHVRSQEIVPWGGARLLLDCITVVTRPGSRWDRPYRQVVNRRFMAEAASVRAAASVYL